jgi:hypothetical protein
LRPDCQVKPLADSDNDMIQDLTRSGSFPISSNHKNQIKFPDPEIFSPFFFSY